ncbi:MAG: hypothetical protein K6G23_10945, partial [Lachnospiraceae bacterium]|nr:hypothetical protein [Lachnospiraceae bacterium]
MNKRYFIASIVTLVLLIVSIVGTVKVYRESVREYQSAFNEALSSVDQVTVTEITKEELPEIYTTSYPGEIEEEGCYYRIDVLLTNIGQAPIPYGIDDIWTNYGEDQNGNRVYVIPLCNSYTYADEAIDEPVFQVYNDESLIPVGTSKTLTAYFTCEAPEDESERLAKIRVLFSYELGTQNV